MQDRKYHNNEFCSRRVNQNIFINRSLQIITNSGKIDKQNYQKICNKEIDSLKNFLTNRIRLSNGMLKKFKNYCMVKLFRAVMNKKMHRNQGSQENNWGLRSQLTSFMALNLPVNSLKL